MPRNNLNEHERFRATEELCNGSQRWGVGERIGAGSVAGGVMVFFF